MNRHYYFNDGRVSITWGRRGWLFTVCTAGALGDHVTRKSAAAALRELRRSSSLRSIVREPSTPA